jgi:hypothetical protein
MIHGDQTWEYDGQLNNGDPTREIKDYNEQDLQTLRGRRAHALLYTPKPAQGGKNFLRILLDLMTHAYHLQKSLPIMPLENKQSTSFDPEIPIKVSPRSYNSKTNTHLGFVPSEVT